MRVRPSVFHNKVDLFNIGGFMSIQFVAIHDLSKGDLVRIHGQHAIVKRLSAVESGWEVHLLVGSGDMVHTLSRKDAIEQVPLLRHV
jgi:hypothetical protein